MSAPTMMSNNMIQEETMMMMMQKNQGRVTILGSAPNSLRRTLSADIPSKKWLKKIASSEELFPHRQINTIADSSSSEEDDDEDYEGERKETEVEAEEADAEAERERLEIWSKIQRNKKEEQEKSSSGPFDTWGSIMSTLEMSKSLPVTPYVHPLVKRTKSSLSEKSLEICTESLGSETGSDGLLFSSDPPSSESGESEKEQEQQKEEVKVSDSSSEEFAADEEWYSNNNNHVAATNKKSPPRSFPPPLPSLSFQSKGSSLHMRPHRDNGRLVLEAVSLPPQNNFNAQRQDGRLVLTFTDEEEEEEEEVDEETEEGDYDEEESMKELDEEEFGEDFDEEEKEEGDGDVYEVEYEEDDNDNESEESEVEVVGDAENVIKEAPLMSSEITTTRTTTTNVHRLALMMNNNQKNKPIGLVNRNPNWSEKFSNKRVNFDDVNVVEMEPLPPRVARLIPSPAAASSSFNLNAYEYYWRTKPTTQKAAPEFQIQSQNNSLNNKVIVSGGINQTPGGQQQLLVLRGKNGDYLVHNLKSCKDSRRSLLFWEPYCIATS